VTDCAAFQRTMEKKESSLRIARWALMLEDFKYTIEHRAGTKMRHVDALSRYPVMLIATDEIILKIKKAQHDDIGILPIIKILESQSYEDYFLKSNLLYKSQTGLDLIVVPESMHNEIIKIVHQKSHYAAKVTEEQIKQEYFIPNLKSKVEQCIANCIPCILANKKSGKQEGFLHPILKGDVPFHTYHIDHLGPLPSTNKNYNHILAIIDSFSKFVWLYATKSTTTKEVINKLEMQKVYFGNPVQIISDKGSAFTSNEFREYCETEGIKHSTITTGLPRANGQVERLNRTILSVLSKLTVDEPDK